MHDPTTHSLGNLMTVFVDDLFTMQADVFLGLDIMLRLAQTIQARRKLPFGGVAVRVC